jgi:hypothetical protein
LTPSGIATLSQQLGGFGHGRNPQESVEGARDQRSLKEFEEPREMDGNDPKLRIECRKGFRREDAGREDMGREKMSENDNEREEEKIGEGGSDGLT